EPHDLQDKILAEEITSEEISSDESTSEEIRNNEFSDGGVPETVKEERISKIIPSENIEDPGSREIQKILIVEDNDELRRMFGESFKKLGDVLQAKNGVEALEIATQTHLHFIITDFD